MGIFDLLLIGFTGFSVWKIWQGSSSLTARLMMLGFLAFIIGSVYV